LLFQPYNLYPYGIDIINTDLEALAKQVGCMFTAHNTKSPEWKRIFVLDKDGVSIGKITLQNSQIYNFKHYKPDYIETISAEDKIYLRLNSLLKTGDLLPSDIYDKFVTEAKIIADKDLEEKKAWRAANPPGKNKRKGLKRRSERWLVISMVRDWCDERIQEKRAHEQAQETEKAWHQKADDIYEFTEDGFCDGFTKV